VRRFKLWSEGGSAAVEFAIVLPVLLVLVIGTIEFGRVLYLENSITNASRVAARTMAIEASASNPNAVSDAKNAAVNAAAVFPALTTAQVSIPTTSCTPPANGQVVYVSVSIAYPVTQITGFMPVFPTALPGKATMRCDG
jgi:Flp pilus assembly protein TadG